MEKLRNLFKNNGDCGPLLLVGAVFAIPMYVIGIIAGSIWLGLVAGFVTIVDR